MCQEVKVRLFYVLISLVVASDTHKVTGDSVNTSDVTNQLLASGNHFHVSCAGCDRRELQAIRQDRWTATTTVSCFPCSLNCASLIKRQLLVGAKNARRCCSFTVEL